MTNRRVKKSKGQVDEEEKRKIRTKSRVRAKVEWLFCILKRVFHYTKVRYRGIKKNHEWLLTAFALVNLYQHRKRQIPNLPRWGRSVPGGRNGLQMHYWTPAKCSSVASFDQMRARFQAGKTNPFAARVLRGLFRASTDLRKGYKLQTLTA
jgi:hypothetical protein